MWGLRFEWRTPTRFRVKGYWLRVFKGFRLVPQGLNPWFCHPFKGPQGSTLDHVMAILRPYWGNLLGVRPVGYNPGTLEVTLDPNPLNTKP